MTTEEQTPVAAEIATNNEMRIDVIQLLASVDHHIEFEQIPSEKLIGLFKKLAAHFPHIEWHTK